MSNTAILSIYQLRGHLYDLPGSFTRSGNPRILMRGGSQIAHRDYEKKRGR